MCDGRCTHTPCRTHIFLTHFLCVTCRHRVHSWLKVFAVRMSELDLLTLSVLMFHPPSLLFPHGHFETTFPSVPSSSNCRRPVKRTSARAARSLATWPIPRTPQLLCESSHPRRQRYTTTFESTNKTPTDSQTGRSADNLKNGLLVGNLHACMDFSLKTDLSQRGHRSSHALHALASPDPGSP